MHGAQVIMVRGNFDDCLRLSRGLADDYPVALVNSVNPMRLEGQKTASFEIVDFLGDAPDVHVLPVGNAGNISAYWMGYREYADGRPRHPHARGCCGWQAAGAAPLVLGEPGRRPRDRGLRDPHRQPRLVAPRGRRRGRVGRAVPARSPTSRSSPRSGSSPPATASSSSRPRPPGVAGLLAEAARGRRRTPGKQVVVTVTGHGLKDIDTALSTFTDLVDTVVDADVDAAAPRPAGLR